MTRLRLYRKGGKLFFKKGGKFYPYYGDLPKAQSGLDVRDQDANTVAGIQHSLMNAKKDPSAGTGSTTKETFGSKLGNSMKGWMSDSGNQQMMTNMATGLVGAIPDSKDNIDYGNKYYEASRKHSDAATKKSQSDASGLASSFGMWGQLGAAKSNLDSKLKPEQGAEYKDTVGYRVKQTFLPSKGQEYRRTVNQKSTTGGEKVGEMALTTFKTVLPFLNWVETPSERRAKEAKKASKHLAQEDTTRDNLFNNSTTGYYTNAGIYGRMGTQIKTPRFNKNGRPNAEIEKDEIVWDPNGQMGQTELTSPGASTSKESKFAAKFHGDKHGQDTDGDGQEGIAGKFPEGSYVFSEFLGMNGKRIRKKKKKGGKVSKKQKSVADTAKPFVDMLNKIEENQHDAAINNPVNTKRALAGLEQTMNEAEQGKKEVAVMEMLGVGESEREMVRQMIQANPEAFVNVGQEQDVVEPDTKQRGGEVPEGFAQEEQMMEDTQEEQIAEEEVEETPINPFVTRLASKIPNLVREDININSLTGDETDVLSNEVKQQLMNEGLTEDDLNIPIKNLTKGRAGRAVSKLLRKQRENQAQNEQNLLNETEELPQRKNGGQMRRQRRRLARYQGPGDQVITDADKQKGLNTVKYLYSKGKRDAAIEYINRNLHLFDQTMTGEMTPSGDLRAVPQRRYVQNTQPVKAVPNASVNTGWDMGGIQKFKGQGQNPSVPSHLQANPYGQPILNSNANSPIYSGSEMVVPNDVFSAKRQPIQTKQQGGEMQPGAESDAHMQQLLAQEEGMVDDGAMAQEGMEGMEGMDPNAMAGLPPEVQQIMASLPPEVQQMVMQDPQLMQLAQTDPEQFMIAIQSMMAGGQGGAPQGAPMAPQGGAPMMAKNGGFMGNRGSKDFTKKSLSAVMKRFDR